MTLLVSCDKNVNDEVKIEKAMIEHARINFSNPNNYKGIEEIIPIDTIDFEKNAREKDAAASYNNSSFRLISQHFALFRRFFN